MKTPGHSNQYRGEGWVTYSEGFWKDNDWYDTNGNSSLLDTPKARPVLTREGATESRHHESCIAFYFRVKYTLIPHARMAPPTSRERVSLSVWKSYITGTHRNSNSHLSHSACLHHKTREWLEKVNEHREERVIMTPYIRYTNHNSPMRLYWWNRVCKGSNRCASHRAINKKYITKNRLKLRRALTTPGA